MTQCQKLSDRSFICAVLQGGGMLLEVLAINKNIKQVGVYEGLGILYKEIKEKAAENASKKKKGKKKKKK